MYLCCDVNFIDFWEFTFVECAGMLKIANEKSKIESYKRAELLVWIANAPRVERRDRKPWTINDFLPDHEHVEREMTAEEIERIWWNEAV